MHQVRKLPHIDGELGWLETTANSNISFGTHLKGDHEFDIVIVGAGFTGISTAIRLAEINPDTRIAVVDALRVGEGSSGRNAGFLIDLPHNMNFAETGVDHARSLFDLNMFAIERLREFKDRYSIPSWTESGKFMAAHEESNLAGLDNFAGMLKQAGFEYEMVSGSDLAKRLGTPYYRSAVYTKGNVLVNPATLVRGLVQALPSSVTLFENSPVHGIEYGTPHKLQFLGGSIKAKIVVQATNAFAEQFGKCPNRVVPIFTYASLTDPLTDEQIQQYFHGVEPWGLTSAHPVGTTVRFTHDKRIFIRNTYDYITDLRTENPQLQKAWAAHRASFELRFPFLKSMDFKYTWGGVFAVTRNHEPIFTNPEQGVYVISGCNGVGVVKGTYMGYYMADYISGIESEQLKFIFNSSKPTWVPSDPIRSVVSKIRLSWEANKAQGDV